MCKRNYPYKKEAIMGCVRNSRYRAMSNELFLKRCVSSGSLSLFISLCLAICLFLFCFVGLFSTAVFDANFRISCFVFLLDRIPFTSERFCGGLFLGLSPLAPL